MPSKDTTKQTIEASPVIADDASTISAFTLPGSLIANSNDHRYSKLLTRQDSATLPHGDHPLMNSPQSRNRPLSNGSSASGSRPIQTPSVPPVPPLPSTTPGMGVGKFWKLKNGEGSVAGPSSYKRSRESETVRQSKVPLPSRTVETPPISRTPNTTKVFIHEQHVAHGVSPVTEASSPGSAERDRDGQPASATSSKPSQPSPLSRAHKGPSESDQYLSPSPHFQSRSPPLSKASSRSGDDIEQVLDDLNGFYRTASSSSTGGRSTPSASIHDGSSTGRGATSHVSGRPEAYCQPLLLMIIHFSLTH